MPCRLIRLSAIAASLPSRACSLCTVIVIGTSSAIVAGVSGSVGVVEEPEDVRVVQDLEHVRMAAAALHVVGVHGPPGRRGDRVGQVPGLVQRVGVQRDRQPGRLGHGQAGVDLGRGRAPVLVHLEPARPGLDRRLEQRRRPGRPAGQERRVERDARPARHHRPQVVGRVRADVPHPADAHRHHRGDPRRQGRRRDLRAGRVHVRVDQPGGGDQPLARQDRGVRVDHQVHPRLHVRVARPPGADDPAAGDPDRGLAHPEHRVEHQHVGDDQVERARARPGRDAEVTSTPSRAVFPHPPISSSPG